MARFSFKRRPKHFVHARGPTHCTQKYNKRCRFSRYPKKTYSTFRKCTYRGRYSRLPRRRTYRQQYNPHIKRPLKRRTPPFVCYPYHLK
jgi:hypothetical protein